MSRGAIGFISNISDLPPLAREQANRIVDEAVAYADEVHAQANIRIGNAQKDVAAYLGDEAARAMTASLMLFRRLAPMIELVHKFLPHQLRDEAITLLRDAHIKASADFVHLACSDAREHELLGVRVTSELAEEMRAHRNLCAVAKDAEVKVNEIVNREHGGES